MNKIKKLHLGLLAVLLITLVSLDGCVPVEGAEGGTDWTWLILLGLFFAFLYFVLIRPQRKKQKAHEELVAELRRGDKVITAGGIYGVIESTAEDSIIIKVESGTTIRVARSSVALKRDS